jgi:hypothetical protein
MTMKIDPNALDPDLVSIRIGVPLDHWFGQCHMVAVLIHHAGLVGGSVCYGKYRGDISTKSPLHGVTTRHGWIEVDGQVYDPTRWVWEGVEPYIYLGSGDEYISSQRERAIRSESLVHKLAKALTSLFVGRPY